MRLLGAATLGNRLLRPQYGSVEHPGHRAEVHLWVVVEICQRVSVVVVWHYCLDGFAHGTICWRENVELLAHEHCRVVECTIQSPRWWVARTIADASAPLIATIPLRRVREVASGFS